MNQRWPFVVTYTLCVGVTCLAASYLAVVFAFVVILLDPKIDNAPYLDILKPAFNNSTLAFIGIVIGVCTYALSRHGSSDTDKKPPEAVPPAG